jgi:fumarate hydratase subunit beta
MSAIKIETPFTAEKARTLRAGDSVLMCGTVYTARDAAHARLCALLERGETPPFDLRDAVVYYVGPTPAQPGQVIGSAGPTTSYRMDAYSPQLLALGLRGMIGKGARSPEVLSAIREHSGVYLAAIGGAGALMAACVKSSELVAWEDLGSEAIRRLTVEDMPLIVVNDCHGGNWYEQGRAAYLGHGL